ncbi:MAG: dienelactone hydrolase family protein [Actinomycetota bacterium]
MSVPPPGTGYFVAPANGPGPAVLVIPSPWGLTTSLKQRADELAEAGFSVLVPDLNDGTVASDEAEADRTLVEMDMNVAASLVQSSLRLLRSAAADPSDPIGVLGFAAGASWALWLAERLADDVAAVVGFYGTQSLTFRDTRAAFLLHFGAHDTVVTDDEVALLGLNLQMAGADFRIERHDHAGHGFAEAERPTFNGKVEAISWRQSLDFLAEHLRKRR